MIADQHTSRHAGRRIGKPPRTRKRSTRALHDHDRVLVELWRSEALARGDFAATIGALTEAAARALRVERVGIWLYDNTRALLRCADVYEVSRDTHSQGTELTASDYPGYFTALEEERVIDAHDARRDPRTHQLTTSYLVPLRIVSMLDAPISVGGRMVGVICHEHVGRRRQWSDSEQRFARSLADLVALASEAAERVRATQALKQSEARFRSMIEHASDLVAVLDANGIIHYASPSHEHVLGYAPADLIGRNALELLHPDDLAHITGLLATATVDGPATTATEFRYRHRDGSWRTVDAMSRNLLSDPVVAGIVVNSRDITERKRAEAVANALVLVGRKLISTVDFPALLDRLCRVTTEVLNCDISYVLVRDIERGSFVPMAGYGHSTEEWESLRVMTFPFAAIPDVHNQLARGEVVPFVVRDSPGVSAMTVASAYGITSVLCMGLLRNGELYGVHTAGYRHRHESFAPEQFQIARGISQLASLALENARLLVELDRANQLKSEFVATMSHELRTPLNVITGYADMLLDGAYGALPSDLRDPLLRVRKSADGLLDLVSSTLDLSRLETGRVGVEVSPVELPTFVGTIVSEARDTLMKTRVTIADSVVGPLPIVHTDPKKLKVVLKNLLTNAVKFTDEGRIEVEVRSEANGVLFTVSDTGIGIAAEALPTIFDAFRQATHSATRDYGGVGLGLFIVRRLLDLLEGTVWIDSQPNVGTTVRVWLPVGAEQQRS